MVRRIGLSLACLLIWATTAYAQGALVTQATGNETANATGVSLSAGDLVVVALRERDGNTMAVSDSVNGAYTRCVAAPITVVVIEIWYFRNSAAGTASFTVTGGSVRDYNVSVWSGMQDVACSSNGTTNSATTSQTHGSVTPSGSALLVTAFGGATHGGVTPHSSGGAFTALTAGPTAGAVDRQYYAYKLAHTGTINPTHTTGNSITTNAAVAVFLETAAGGAAPKQQLLLGCCQ